MNQLQPFEHYWESDAEGTKATMFAFAMYPPLVALVFLANISFQVQLILAVAIACVMTGAVMAYNWRTHEQWATRCISDEVADRLTRHVAAANDAGQPVPTLPAPVGEISNQALFEWTIDERYLAKLCEGRSSRSTPRRQYVPRTHEVAAQRVDACHGVSA